MQHQAFRSYQPLSRTFAFMGVQNKGELCGRQATYTSRKMFLGLWCRALSYSAPSLTLHSSQGTPQHNSVQRLQWRQAFSAAHAAIHDNGLSSRHGEIQANICMVGAGNMGGAMLTGWISSGSLAAERTSACTRNPERIQQWNSSGLQVFGDILDADEAKSVCDFSDIIFLGVKPQFLGPVLDSLSQHIKPKHTVVSVAAGWTLQQLENRLPTGTAVMRVMPNTPVLVGQGACAYCMGTYASDADREVVHRLLEDTGVALEVPESSIDAVVGVAGSAPAYMFQVLEAMADGGVRSGLPRKQALLLAAQTMKGAACMVLEGGKDSLGHPGVLKDQVTSPAGATIAAVASLEKNGLRATFMEAVDAAATRSADMAAMAETSQ